MNLRNEFTKIFITLIFILFLFLNTSKVFGYSKESLIGVIRQAGEDKNQSLRVQVVDPSGKTSNNSVFGESITAIRKDMISVQFQYNLSTYETVYTLTGSGTIEHDSPIAILRSASGTVEGTVEFKTKKAVRYRPGHECYAYFTAKFTDYWSSITQEITTEIKQTAGLCTGNDGFAIGLSNEVFGVFRKKRGQVEFYPQSSFNKDKIDGTGISKFNIDISSFNVFRITFGYLGVANVFFEVLSESGEWINFHRIDWSNTHGGTHINNPVLPIRFCIIKKTSEVDLTIELSTASCGAGITDGASQDAGDRFQTATNAKSVTANIETNILTLKITDEINDITNNVLSKLILLSAATEGTKTIKINIYKNASIGGTQNFSYINKGSSSLMLDTSGTTVEIGAGSILQSFSFAKSDSKQIDLSNLGIDFLKNETITFSAVSTANFDIDMSIRIKEEF